MKLTDDLKFKIITRMWLSSCLTKACFLALVIAVMLSGTTRPLHAGIMSLVMMIFAWIDAKYLLEERLLRGRASIASECIWSWSVAPYYFSVWITLVLVKVYF